MERRKVIKNLVAALPTLLLSKALLAEDLIGNSAAIARGPFKPTWDSLKAYQTPDWFKDAKFGIWAHWGPQCQPERGDWYARKMYIEGSEQYKFHVEKFGHPSKFGFKDVINEWKAEEWDPEAIVSLYKRAGAQYFFALANHHDNFDLYNSKYHKWNSVNIGPKKDIIGGWARAAKNNGLKFGVSVHAAHAWTWYETAQKADTIGALAGVSYDGKLNRHQGKGTWWEGLDPQELYAQNHLLSTNNANPEKIHNQWDWVDGASIPSKEYCNSFFNRTIDLLDTYEPDLIYFDDTALPLWPINDAGLKIAAHMYNKSIKKNGKLEAVLFGKILTAEQQKCMVWDIERGQSNKIEALPWQTDTCIGKWHYDRRIFDNHKYKSAKTVVQTLVDVVSKNGNLLLNVPLRGNGTMDSDERAVIEEITGWMDINKEAIFGTRPWRVFGEGPALESAAPLTAQGFNEGKGKPFGAQDIRFTTKNNVLFAIVFGLPKDGKVVIKNLGKNNSNSISRDVQKVELLGYDGSLLTEKTDNSMIVQLPEQKPKYVYAYVLKLT